MTWRVLFALALGCAACRKREPPAASETPAMPASEVKRNQDACKAYADKVCGCAQRLEAMRQPCALSRALPEAIEVALGVAANPESSRRSVLQAYDSVRNVGKECIEEIARLPVAGCP